VARGQIIAKVTKAELIRKLKEVKDLTDREGAHIEADEYLLRYINDPDITSAWNRASANFWYA
jgi:hypothetical protein